MRPITGLLILALIATAVPARGDSTREQLRILQEQAMAAYKAGNFGACAKGFATALAIRPHHPRLLYNFAACSAKGGNATDAIRALDEYAGMGLIAEVEHDEDFASLKDQASFKAVLTTFKMNARPVGSSKIIARLRWPFLAEGIAYDPVSKRLFVSSVDERRIVQVTEDGHSSDFVTSTAIWLLGAFGMAINAKNGELWVATSGVPHARALQESERDSACVSVFSLISQPTTRSTCWPPKPGRARIIGDLVVAGDGVVFATDSVEPVIYAVTSSALQRGKNTIGWLESDAFVSLQGITTTPDEEGLIAADYAKGLHFIDRDTKAIQTIDFAGGTTLLGIDGLTRNGNTLLAVQNGIAPQRILAMTLDTSGRSIANVKVISANDPNIPEPSLGTFKGDDFCVVANAQWSRFNDDGTRKAALDPPQIACVSLK